VHSFLTLGLAWRMRSQLRRRSQTQSTLCSRQTCTRVTLVLTLLTGAKCVLLNRRCYAGQACSLCTKASPSFLSSLLACKFSAVQLLALTEAFSSLQRGLQIGNGCGCECQSALALEVGTSCAALRCALVCYVHFTWGRAKLIACACGVRRAGHRMIRAAQRIWGSKR
jgi:hypothetical protein